MGFYRRRVFPFLVDRALRNQDASVCRSRILPLAAGKVLEIGIGSGLNLPHYGSGVTGLIGIDPSSTLLSMTQEQAALLSVRTLLVQASAEAIPLASESIDTVVMTWTLCSIPDPLRGLREMRRVLRPNGRLLFIEHGLAPDRRVARWQRWLDPLWARISCHLERPVNRLLEQAGFVIEELTTGYVGQGPRLVTYLYQGSARPGGESSAPEIPT
ncbi:class I SAM-dependent methyltransferase [Methylobacterium sp. 2A]|nr:class I SAM-dependent methyltransferase [Methylobacterium sp. 2A]MWV25130.1 class I SAM-dependent methyltransferase [Methylobacterium sp. 2A]